MPATSHPFLCGREVPRSTVLSPQRALAADTTTSAWFESDAIRKTRPCCLRDSSRHCFNLKGGKVYSGRCSERSRPTLFRQRKRREQEKAGIELFSSSRRHLSQEALIKPYSSSKVRWCHEGKKKCSTNIQDFVVHITFKKGFCLRFFPLDILFILACFCLKF